MEFDLQRFDDEQATTTEGQPSAAEQNPIPNELDGIPEDIARETMAEWEESKPKPESEPQPAPVTYSQTDYQAKVDEVENLKAQLAKYQRQDQAKPQQQTAQPQQPTFQPPQLKITPEISAKISEAVKAEAMSMTGFTADDVESLTYAEDDDPRLAQWSQAKSMAQARVIKAINDAQAWQQQRAKYFYDEHTAAVKSYNEFAQKEFLEPDFKEIQEYATNEFFDALSPNEQKVLANSYLRVERQTASPAEMLVVKNYYERAKAAYRGRKAQKAAPAKPQVKMPRVDQVGGAAGTGEITIGELEKMLETTDFDKIPKAYQDRLLGY